MTRAPSWARALPLALLSLALAVPAAPAAAPSPDDAALDQRIDREQHVATGRAVLADGHVDVGPRFVDGRWTLMVHDDAAKSGGGRSVWRSAERTVLRVSDAARRQAPDDPAYRFLRAEPGADLWVVPQTQDPDVVWVGWNTQDPAVMEQIDRGVRLTLLGVQGPGSLIVYLQSGDFAEPGVLWDSAARPRPAWVDVNTHTHANWVFSAPGVHLVRVRVEAELIDGTTVSDTRELRFAVGSRTNAERAFAARWRGGPAPETDASAAAAAADDAGEERSGSGVAVVAIAVVALGLAAALALVLRRGAAAKRRAREQAAGGIRAVGDARGAGTDEAGR